MRIVGQLFTRDSTALGENEYIVCGIIKTDEPLPTEHVNIISADAMALESNSFPMYSRGNGFDGIMRSPMWRRFKPFPDSDGFYCVHQARDPETNPGNKPCPDTDKCHLCGKKE